MGYNTTVVVMNDALEQIASDNQFGKKLRDAVLGLSLGIDPKTGRHYRSQDVSAHNHVNAATVIETHHADHHAIVAVGGNYGTVLGHAHCDQDQKLAIIKQLAESMGYTLRKKAQR